MSDTDRAVPLREVAERFGVAPQTIRTWVRAKKFPAPIAVGKRKWLFSTLEIEKVLLGQLDR
jgi:predicted DNA-binding transcriptional regulator AlpA